MNSVPGVGGALYWFISAGGNVGNTYPNVSIAPLAVSSYAVPFIVTVDANGTLATAGGQVVTITGGNFGPASAVDNLLSVTFTHVVQQIDSIVFRAENCR